MAPPPKTPPAGSGDGGAASKDPASAGGASGGDAFEDVDVHDLDVLTRLTSSRTRMRYEKPPEKEKEET